MNKRSIHVCIVGGGIAGLSAAATLAARGIQVTLLDAGPHLGGRARSVAIEFNSQIIQLDNGQHIALGAYQETLKLLANIGISESEAFLRLPLNLEMRAGTETVFKLAPPSFLPAPIDQLIGILACKGFSWRDKIAVMRFMQKLKNSDYRLVNDLPLADFLQQHQQSNKVVTMLWQPLCLAALNTPIHIASSKIFLNVLRDTFNSKTSSDFLLPKLDLSQLFSQPISSFIKARKAAVLQHKRVKNIKTTANGYAVCTKDEEFEASHVIIAASPVRLRNIIGDLPKLKFTATQTKLYDFQPIYTIYLQYPRNTSIGQPMLGLVGGLSQWVFDRGILCGQSGLMAVIISASGEHQQLTQDALALKVAQELHEAFPQLVKPLWHKVIAEKRATFSCNVNLARPAHVTPYPHLYLAGDYTYADYPATIEGAVRSGVACADLVSNS